MASRALESLNPTSTVELDSSLSLVPRLRLLLTVHRADKSVSPIDGWKLKTALLSYLKSAHSISLSNHDIRITHSRTRTRNRDDPVARGTLCVGDFGFLSRVFGLQTSNQNVEKSFRDWRKGFLQAIQGIHLTLEGVRFKLTVHLPKMDDFELINKEWEEMSAFGVRGYPRDVKYQPDTIVLRGMPSRWFAEPRVSSKPSMLVSHTIFSVFGKIRNLHVAEDDDVGKDEDEDEENIVSGLNCKIVVRFDKHKDFCAALKALCGRSLHKKGSRLRADYDVTWDKDGFFQNARSHTEDESRWKPESGSRVRSNGIRHHSSISRLSPENSRPKRFKE